MNIGEAAAASGVSTKMIRRRPPDRTGFRANSRIRGAAGRSEKESPGP